MTTNQRLLAALAVMAVLLFVFRDQIGFFHAGGMTSDTQVTWDSCTVTADKNGAPYSFIRCTEPTMVWMAYKEGDFGNPDGVNPDRLRNDAQLLAQELLKAFRDSHRLSTDMTNTSEDVVLGGSKMLWDDVYAQSLVKINKFDEDHEKELGHGLTMVHFEPGLFGVLVCVSHTDSETLCENAGDKILYEGLDAAISP